MRDLGFKASTGIAPLWMRTLQRYSVFEWEALWTNDLANMCLIHDELVFRIREDRRIFCLSSKHAWTPFDRETCSPDDLPLNAEAQDVDLMVRACLLALEEFVSGEVRHVSLPSPPGLTGTLSGLNGAVPSVTGAFQRLRVSAEEAGRAMGDLQKTKTKLDELGEFLRDLPRKKG